MIREFVYMDKEGNLVAVWLTSPSFLRQLAVEGSDETKLIGIYKFTGLGYILLGDL